METNRTLSMMTREDWRTAKEIADAIMVRWFNASLVRRMRQADAYYEQFKKGRP